MRSLLLCLALLLFGCDRPANDTSSTESRNGDSADQVGEDGDQAADFAGQSDAPGPQKDAAIDPDDEDYETYKVHLGGMVITRKRPRNQKAENNIRVHKPENDSGFDSAYDKRGAKGEHLDRDGKVVRDAKGKPIKMH